MGIMDKCNFIFWYSFPNQFLFKKVIYIKFLVSCGRANIAKDSLCPLKLLETNVFLVNILCCLKELAVTIYFRIWVNQPGIGAEQPCFVGNLEHIIDRWVYIPCSYGFRTSSQFLHHELNTLRRNALHNFVFPVL